VLSSIRSGACSAATLERLRAACTRPLGTADSILPTMVCPLGSSHNQSLPIQQSSRRNFITCKVTVVGVLLQKSPVLGCCQVQLYTHTEDVDAINKRQLEALDGEALRFHAQDIGSRETLDSACPVCPLAVVYLSVVQISPRIPRSFQNVCCCRKHSLMSSSPSPA
jgi:hypothetical protein